MPPHAVSIVLRRSEGFTGLQRLLRRSFAHACVVDTSGTEKAVAPLGFQNVAKAQKSLHTASSSRGNPISPQNPLLDIALSIEHRLKLLQQEHKNSQLHQSSHADRHQAGDMVRKVEGRPEQQQKEAQWARYKEHRAAADQYAAHRQADLHNASLNTSLSSERDTGQEASGEEDSGQMQQLRRLLDSPLSLMTDNMGLQRELAAPNAVAGQDSYVLREPDARSAKAQPVPRTVQHSSEGSMAVLGGLEGRREVLVPIHSQQLLQAGIVGVPNSGKSTLTNALVGQKVTAVSAKTNTTGSPRLGAFTEGDSQVALYDTPGVVHTRSLHGPRHVRSVRSAWGTASQCDMLMCIVDAHRQILKPDIRVYGLVEELASGPMPDWNPLPTVLILNKVDLLTKEQGASLLQLRDRFLQLFPFQDTFCISARHGAGVQELKQYLLERCKPGRWIVRPWEATDMGPSEIATELVRENLFKRLYKEVPYNLDILDASMRYLRDGSIRIEKHIMVASEQHRTIVVGTNGAVIGEVGIAARKALETVLSKRVHLMLYVKVIPR